MSDQQLIYTMQRIGGLLFRRLHDELSEGEQETLETWLRQRDPASRQFFEEVTDWDQVQAALHSMYDFDADAALADVQKKIQAMSILALPTIPEPVSPYTPRIRRLSWLSAAAAVVLVAGGVVIYTLNKGKGKTEISIAPIEQRFKNDVAPGSDKAILQLADGSQILLDSATKGELAKQGNTKVFKLDNGRLAYHSSKVGFEPMSYNTISTPRGGQYQVKLPDGSNVWLNAASSLKFPTAFTGKDRTVELNGEAYFQIAKNVSLPFRVNVIRLGQAEPLTIEVLGTEFNVMAYGDEADQRTTLIDGAVKVSAAGSQVSLEPGQQARLKNTNSALNLIPSIELENITAWKNGLFKFQDASIQDLMRQVARWYDVEIVYEGKVDQQFIGTISRQVNIAKLLKILESTGWVHFIIEGKKITVLP